MKHRSRLSWLGPILKSHRSQIALALGLGLLTYLCSVFLMVTSGYLMAKTAVRTTTLFMVMIPVAVVQLCGFGRPVARYFERLVIHDWVFKATSLLRLKLFRHLRMSMEASVAHNPLGRYLGILNRDIAGLQNLFLRIIFPAVIAMGLYLLVCLVCGWFSPVLGIITFFGAGACVLLLPALALLWTSKSERKLSILKASWEESFTDSLLGAKDYYLSGQGAAVARSFKDAYKYQDSLALKSRGKVRFLSTLSALIMGILALIYLAVTGQAWGGTPEMQNYIAAFVLGLFPLMEIFMLLPAAMAEITGHKSALSNLGAVLESPLPASSKTEFLAQSPSSEPLKPESLTIRNLEFSYDAKQMPLMTNFNLSLKPNEKVALLGKSGSGKSTLINLIGGTLSPQKGSIALDGVLANQEAKPIILNQSPYIFRRSLKENLTLANDETDDQNLESLLESVGLGEKYRSLSQGLNTSIGDGFVGFSGGQAHRLALARTLLAKGNLWLLDEPFNALDPTTEAGLLDTILRTSVNKTLLVATHHLSGIFAFDRVLLMEDGKIVGDGSPQELKETNKHFQELLALEGRGSL